MTPLNQNTVNLIFNDKQFQNLFFDLKYRWDDEQDYEDINDYAIPIIKSINRIMPDNDFVQNLSMTKQPFGVKIQYPYTLKDGTTINGIVKIFVKGSNFQWTVEG